MFQFLNMFDTDLILATKGKQKTCTHKNNKQNKNNTTKC